MGKSKRELLDTYARLSFFDCLLVLWYAWRKLFASRWNRDMDRYILRKGDH